MKAIRGWYLPLVTLVALLSAVFLILSCGGGGSSSSSAPPAGVSRGVVTGFGSIFVDGVEYATSGTTRRFRLDDNNVDIPGLDNEVFRVGMVVTVHHKASDNSATDIEYADDLKGPVEAGSINLYDNTFRVLGITVQTFSQDNQANATHFDDLAGLAALADGNIVEVSGLPADNGWILATYVSLEGATSDADPFEVKGYVSDLTASSFTLKPTPASTGGVAVTYTGGTVLQDLPAGGLANGIFVEVKTSSTTAPISAGTIEGKVDLAHDGAGAARVSVSGFVAGLTGTSPNFTFYLGAQQVATSATTVGFELVAAGARLDAEGAIDANGVLQAVKIEPDL